MVTMVVSVLVLVCCVCDATVLKRGAGCIWSQIDLDGCYMMLQHVVLGWRFVGLETGEIK